MAFGIVDQNTGDSISPTQQFVKSTRDSLFNILTAVNVAKYDPNFVGSGVQGSLGHTITSGASISSTPPLEDPFAQLFPRSYNIGSMTPNANVFVKKRMFTTMAHENDVRFMDSFERAFMRVSKNLFQLKAFQIATYESLTKFEQVLKQDHTLFVPAILNAVQNANAFGAITDQESSVIQSTLLQITQRDLAGDDTNFTRWIIDQFDLDLANIGRGVGVLELTNFTKVDISNSLTTSGNCSIEFEDPYHILMISNDDIESTIRHALFDSFTSTLASVLGTDKLSTLTDSLQSQLDSSDSIKAAQAQAAINTVQETASDVLRPQFDSPAMVDFVRKKMRKFYLGKAIIQPTDGIHIFMTSDTIYENDEDPVGLPLGLDRFGVDDQILRQEMVAVTGDEHFDFNLYKLLRDKNAFTGASVFAGVVEKVTDSFSEGFYTLSITAKNNLWYLEQSFINVEPALDQSQGVLHDPLTPFDLKFDSFGNLKTTDNAGNVGFNLTQDNIDKLSQVGITHESGNLRGHPVTQDNIKSTNYPGTNIQQVEHFPGMAYRWKEGVASTSATINTSDPTGLFTNAGREVINNAFGLTVTETPFDNMDAANVVSLMVTGQPYNLTAFINDASQAAGLNSIATKSSSDATSYFSSFFDIVNRQNKTLGNFKPLLDGNSVNVDTVKKLVSKKISFQQLDVRIGQLEEQITAAQDKLHALPLSTTGPETDLLAKTRQGLETEIASLRQEQDLLIAEFDQLSVDIDDVTKNQDALGFSLDPDERAAQLLDFQFRQLYVASKRIEDVRYNRDTNYFVVGTEYDADLDIRAFLANLRRGFNLFKNRYDPVITKAREASEAINFEFFADNSGNIRFRPPQYNKVPLSVYYELFRRKGQQGIDLLPDFIKDLFVQNITGIREQIVQANWNILIALGKSGDGSLVDALQASSADQGILNFLGLPTSIDGKIQSSANGTIIVSDGNTTDELIEFTSADQVIIDRAVPPSSRTVGNPITLTVLQAIGRQMEVRFGTARIKLTEDDIVADSDQAARTKRKELFTTLRTLSSQRNSLVKSYLGQLNKLGVNADSITALGEIQSQNIIAAQQQQQQDIQAIVENAVSAKQDQLTQEVLQVVMTGNVQGFFRPAISPEFSNLIEDDSRNFIGRGSGRRFVVRDDSITSFRIEESQPDFCRITVEGGQNFIDGHTVMEGRWLWAGAVDYDLWRQYGFKSIDDVKVPFLSDPETQLKPYAVFKLLQQRRKVMRGTVTVVGNEYYQLGDCVYLADRDMMFYVTGINHSFGEGVEFSTTLTLEYGRPPGEYIPSPLDVIGKVLLKQNTSSLSLTRRQLNPDTFYYPLRPTPVLYLSNVQAGDINGLEKMLGTDSNQGRLINLLLNANFALQKPNAVLVISGFKTGSENDSGVEARIATVQQWFTAPKILQSSLNGQNLKDFTKYQAISTPGKIETKILDVSIEGNQVKIIQEENNANQFVASDQTIIQDIGNQNELLGIRNACQEAYALVGDNSATEELPNVIEVGIFYKRTN